MQPGLKPSPRYGISLVETLIVLAIFAILVSAIWMSAATAFSNKKKTQFIGETLQIVTSIRGLFQGHQADSVIGFDTKAAVAAGVFPAEMVVDRNAAPFPDIRHPYATSSSILLGGISGAVQLAIGQGGTPGKGVPPDACVELLSRLGGSAEAAARMGLVSVTVNGNSTALPLPISPKMAVDACNQPINNGMTITFNMP